MASFATMTRIYNLEVLEGRGIVLGGIEDNLLFRVILGQSEEQLKKSMVHANNSNKSIKLELESLENESKRTLAIVAVDRNMNRKNLCKLHMQGMRIWKIQIANDIRSLYVCKLNEFEMTKNTHNEQQYRLKYSVDGHCIVIDKSSRCK